MKTKHCNRRDFLKYCNHTTAGALAFGLVGCGSQGTVSNPSANPSTPQTDSPINSAPEFSSWKSSHPFLSGNNYPLFSEGHHTQLRVEGSIPADIRGMYLRNGPNQKFDPISFNHPFDGDGMIHQICIDSGIVEYRNKWVNTVGLLEEEQADKALYRTFEKNTSNTNVIFFNDRILSMYEGGLPYELDLELNTLGEFDFDGTQPYKAIAHPKVDPISGDLHICRYFSISSPYLTYYQYDKFGNLKQEVVVDIPYNTMVHDMAITESSAIFFITPLSFSDTGGTFEWHRSRGTEAIVVSKRSPLQQQSYQLPDFFFWHFVNAFEQNDSIYVDFVHYNGPVVAAMGAPGAGAPTLYRATLNTRQSGIEKLDNSIVEFPVIDSRFIGLKNRYAYIPEIVPGNFPFPLHHARLIQYDMMSGSHKSKGFGNNSYIGEPVIIPKSQANSETSAYVAALIYEGNSQSSYFAIWSVDDFSGETLCKIHLPHRIPNGFHGNWVSQR